MNPIQILVNQNPFEFALPREKAEHLAEVSDVLSQIRTHYPDHLIHAISVNQIPIDLEDLSSAELFPLSEVSSLSVQIKSARSTALETLDHLSDFLAQLSEISMEIRGREDLQRLVSGLTTTVDSLQECRRVLGDPTPEAKVTLGNLEKEMVEIMNEMSDLIESNKDLGRHPLLQISLPRHLQRWRGEGIAALIN
jgi:hypothetical protein